MYSRSCGVWGSASRLIQCCWDFLGFFWSFFKLNGAFLCCLSWTKMLHRWVFAFKNGSFCKTVTYVSLVTFGFRSSSVRFLPSYAYWVRICRCFCVGLRYMIVVGLTRQHGVRKSLWLVSTISLKDHYIWLPKSQALLSVSYSSGYCQGTETFLTDGCQRLFYISPTTSEYRFSGEIRFSQILTVNVMCSRQISSTSAPRSGKLHRYIR